MLKNTDMPLKFSFSMEELSKFDSANESTFCIYVCLPNSSIVFTVLASFDKLDV